MPTGIGLEDLIKQVKEDDRREKQAEKLFAAGNLSQVSKSRRYGWLLVLKLLFVCIEYQCGTS